MEYVVMTLLFACFVYLMYLYEKRHQEALKWGQDKYDRGEWTLEELIDWNDYQFERYIGKAL